MIIRTLPVVMEKPKTLAAARHDDEADGPPSAPASKQKFVPASGGSIGSSGKQKRQSASARTFLKIGLFAMAAFHFSWVAGQLSALGDSPSRDGLLIAPEYDGDGTDPRAPPSDPGARGRRRHGYGSIYDPRDRPPPARGSPNAELRALVSPRGEYGCPDGLVYVRDHVMPDNVTHPPGRRIPRLFHITAKSRCMTAGFAENVDRWKRALGSGYSIYVHDDAAVNRFIYQRQWTEFPELKEVMGCVTAGAAKADIWRYVMVWEYGGIYRYPLPTCVTAPDTVVVCFPFAKD